MYQRKSGAASSQWAPTISRSVGRIRLTTGPWRKRTLTRRASTVFGVPVRIVSFEELGLVLKKGLKDQFTLTYGEILTAERRRSPRRGLRLHTRSTDPVLVACGDERFVIEDELRRRGVRVVDCWGCIIAPTLADFENEMMNKPVRVRQS